MNFYALVEKAKEAQGLTSDNQLAIKLGTSRGLISAWKNQYSMPDGYNTLRLLELANIKPSDALLLVTEKAPRQGELSLSNSSSVYIM